MKQGELTRSGKRRSPGGRRIFSMLLAVCMVFTLLPATVFAEATDSSDVIIGTSSVYPHHEHDGGCGYREAVSGMSCDHLQENGTYRCDPGLIDSGEVPVDEGEPATPAQATKGYICPHDDDCGFAEGEPGQPCNFDPADCLECNPLDSGAELPAIITGFAALDTAVQQQIVPAGTQLSMLNLPDTLAAMGYTGLDTETEIALTIEGVVWELNPANEVNDGNSTYDPAQGSYAFTPVLPDGYALAVGASLPEIYVMVNAAMPLTLGAEIDITGKNADAIKTAIESALETASIVTVTSSYNAMLSATIELTIPENKKVDWKANYSCTKGSIALDISGKGTFELSAGRIDSIGVAIAANNEGSALNIIISGGEVSSSHGPSISFTGGSVTVSGGSVNEKSGQSAIKANSGMVEVSDGTVSVNVSISGSAIIAENNSTVTVSGGTVYAAGTSGSAIKAENSTVTVSGGMVSASGNFGDCIRSAGSHVTVEGGTVFADGSDGYGVYSQGGSVTVNGGTIYSSQSNAAISSGPIAINKGIILGDVREYGSPVDKGWKVYDTGNTLTMNATIPDGKTLTIPEGAGLTVPSDVTLTNNGTVAVFGTLIGTVGGTIEVPMAEDGDGVKYANISSAIAAANKKGGTITLLHDSSYGKEVNAITGKFTLELAGKTLTLTDASRGCLILNGANAELTITDSWGGRLVSTEAPYAVQVATGKLFVEGGSFRGDEGGLNAGGSVQLTGGTFHMGKQASVTNISQDDTVAGLLAPGYVYYKGETFGSEVADASRQAITETVTVRDCSHKWGDNWQVQPDGSITRTCQNNCNAKYNSDTQTAVAKVVNGSATSYYPTVQEAFNKVPEGTTITLMTNCTEELSAALGKTLTLDLNDKNLTATNSLTIYGGKITIKGTGTVTKLVLINANYAALMGGIYTLIECSAGVIPALASGYAYQNSSGGWETVNYDKLQNVTVKQAPIKITAQPQNVTVSYGTATALTVAAEKRGDPLPGGEITYQWCNAKDTSNISGATTATLTIPNNTNAGSYSYYCKLTLGSCTVRTDIATVTVNKTPCTIENKTAGGYAGSYTYTASPLTAPQASNFDVTDGAGAMTFAWTGTGITGSQSTPPADAGSYTLKVTTAVNGNVGAGELTLPVTIRYLETDAVATLNGTKGDNGWYKGNMTVSAPYGFSLSDQPIATDSWPIAIMINTDRSGDYTYYLKQNSTGYVTGAKTIPVNRDATAPTQPTLTNTNIGGTVDTDTTLTATATDATSGVASYTLTETSGHGVQPQTSTNGEFNLENLLPNKTYRFTVTAKDKAGNVSDASQVNSFSTRKASMVNAKVVLSDDNAFVYDGTAKIPTVKVTLGGKELEASQYTVSYDDNVNAGPVTVTVTASTLGDYTGEVLFKPIFFIARAGITITPDTGINKVYGTTADPVLTYTVSPALVAGNNLTGALSRVAGENVGSYAITQGSLWAGRNYTLELNSQTVNFEITKSSPSLTIETMPGKSYDGTVIANPTADDMTITGALYADVSFAYADNEQMTNPTATSPTDAGVYWVQASIAATGNTNAANSTAVTFTITPKTVSSPTITLAYDTVEYDGTAKKLAVTVKDGPTIIPASEYVVGYSNNISVGTGTVTITDKAGGNYTVSGTTTFAITEKAVTVSITSTGKTYDGTNTATVTYTVSGVTTGEIVTASGISATYADANAGVGKTITATGITLGGADAGNYFIAVNTATTMADITAKSITPTIGAISSVTYDGTQQKPAFTVNGDGKMLVKDTDYTVSYGANITAGTNVGIVTVTAKAGGNYTWTPAVTKNFDIEKAAGSAIPSFVTGSYTGNGTTFTYTVMPISGAEYSMDGSNWVSSNVFTGIVPLAKVTYYARMAEDANHHAGASKNTGEVEFVKLTPTAAPTIGYTVSGSTGSKTITIATVTGAEYKFGSDAWGNTNSKVYATDEVVTIAIRLKATLTHNESPEATTSVNLAKQEQAAPADFVLTYTTNGETDYTVTIPTVTGGEYSFDGSNWSGTNTKTANVGDTVTGYVRYAETSTHNASPSVSASVTLPLFAVKMPTITPGGGTFTGSQIVTITTQTAGATIHYTTDGTTPTAASTAYTGSITLTDTGTVKAIAVKSGMTDSPIANAAFTKSSGGGGGDENTNLTPPTITTPPATPEQPKPITNATTETKATVGTDGKATVNIKESDLMAAFAAAQKADTNKNGVSVTVSVTTDKAANSIVVTLPQNAIKALADAGVTELRIESATVNITIDLATLTQLRDAKGDVIVSANAVKANTLSAAAQAAIGNRPVLDLSITVGGKAVTDFKGVVSIALPYTLVAGENPGNLYVVYVSGADKVTYLTNSSYDANAKLLRFSTNHFSTFGIGYRADAPKFTDTANHWAKNDIDFAAARGLLTGTTATTFSPNTGMTRGMFVTALGRLAGIDTTKYKTAKFTDVPATAYYAPYVAWAAEKGITGGTTETTFSPDKTITRQELAVLMLNYAKAMGYTLPGTREAISFADSASIASWAKDTVTAMQMAGVMNGKDGGKFDPTGTATRAEVAAMLHRYVELIIDPITAQGLDINDSGSAVMYEGGKLVKSDSRTLNGIPYVFNANGEAALPPTKKADTDTV